jgi:hypothetical protein
MSAIYEQHNNAVNELAEELLKSTPSELLKWPDYGNATRNGIDVSFWHYSFSDDKHHIVFKKDRQFLLVFRKSEISGVVFGVNSNPRLMTPMEIAEYD